MKRSVTIFAAAVMTLAACGGSGDDSSDEPPVSTPVLTTAPQLLTTTTTTVPPGPKFYTVQPGDVLSLIADDFGLTLTQLLEANPGISDPARIQVGDQILIPAEEEIQASATTEAPLELGPTTEPTLPELRATTTTTEPDATTSTTAGA